MVQTSSYILSAEQQYDTIVESKYYWDHVTKSVWFLSLSEIVCHKYYMSSFKV